MAAIILYGLVAAVLVAIWRGRNTLADLQPGLEIADHFLGLVAGLAALGTGLAVLESIEPADSE